VPYIPLAEHVQRGVLAAGSDVEAVRLIRAEMSIELGHALGVARGLRAGGPVPGSYDEAAALLTEHQPGLVDQVRKLVRTERTDEAVELLRRRLDAQPAVGARLADALAPPVSGWCRCPGTDRSWLT
jgi:hypothetical protein